MRDLDEGIVTFSTKNARKPPIMGKSEQKEGWGRCYRVLMLKEIEEIVLSLWRILTNVEFKVLIDKET